MTPRGYTQGASVDEEEWDPFHRGRARRRRRAFAWIVAIVSVVGVALAYGKSRLASLQTAVSRIKPKTAGFIRVEDLPRVPFVRIDELPRAAPVAVRPLQPQELTPELIHKADEMLRQHEKPLGTQVVVETADKTYIARFEWHLTYDQNPERPQTWHKGITLYTTE
jgi:hypothetical protein